MQQPYKLALESWSSEQPLGGNISGFFTGQSHHGKTCGLTPKITNFSQ
jgi:hypothetical protein